MSWYSRIALAGLVALGACGFEPLNAPRGGSSVPAALATVQIANISTPDGRSLVIQPYEKSSLKAIEQAIHKSDLGVSPNSDGTVIRIAVPALTEERRKDLIKIVKKIGEESRVAVRNIRRDGDQELKKMKGTAISEDEIKGQEAALQKITDRYVKEIDKILQDKEADLMEV